MKQFKNGDKEGFRIRKTLQNYNAAEIKHTTATIRAKDHKKLCVNTAGRSVTTD